MLFVHPTMAALILLFGCGGSSFHGTLGGGGDNGPTPNVGQPVVTGLSPLSVAAGGPSFTLTVTGKNFAPGDTVVWDNPLASTYISSTQMSAQVPNQLISHPTSTTIFVQTPVPNSLNFGTTFAVNAAPAPRSAGFAVIAEGVQANDMAWDALSKRILLSVSALNRTNPNTITALDPASGAFNVSVGAGPGADRLAVSSDGSWLYAGTNANGSVRRFALPGLTSDITFPLGSAPSGQLYYALDLKAAPANPKTIAVSRYTNYQEAGGVVVYDGPVARAETASSVPGAPIVLLGSLAWNSSASDIYATSSNFVSVGTMFDLSVNADGVQLAQSDLLGDTFSLGTVHYSALTGHVYAADGGVFDPSSKSIVNRLPLTAVGGGFNYTNCSGPKMTLDDDLGIAWAVGQTTDSQQFMMEAFDLRTNALLGSIVIPNVVGVPVKLIRWGADGLAFLTHGCDPIGSSGPEQGDGVYLISGPFVTSPSMQ